METLASIQKEMFELKKQFKVLEEHVKVLETQLGKDVREMRVEAEKVLEKASALVNPYSTKAMTYEKHKQQR